MQFTCFFDVWSTYFVRCIWFLEQSCTMLACYACYAVVCPILLLVFVSAQSLRCYFLVFDVLAMWKCLEARNSCIEEKTVCLIKELIVSIYKALRSNFFYLLLLCINIQNVVFTAIYSRCWTFLNCFIKHI